MKKYFIIIGLLIAAMSYGQRMNWIDTIFLDGATHDTLTGTDTIMWATLNTEHYFGPGGSIEVKFHTLSADDATFGVVAANMDSTWYYVNGSFPITLDRTTYAITNEYGDAVSAWFGRLSDMYWRKIGIYFSKGTCTGYFIFNIRQD